MVPIEFLEKVRKLLVENDVAHWGGSQRDLCGWAPGCDRDQLRMAGDSRRVQDLPDAAA
jgi:hypothetical protein